MMSLSPGIIVLKPTCALGRKTCLAHSARIHPIIAPRS
jgi:hypothetical protein